MSAASVEAALASERRTRQRTGPLPDIPAISLNPFREGTEEGKRRVAAEWDRACREVGFIKIVDHGVPKEVIERCWSATEAFFERPIGEKLAVKMTDDYPYGYNAMGGENLLASLDKDAETPGDLKEMFNVCLGSDTPAADHPPPKWPVNAEREQAAYGAYSRALAGLADTLYRVCALALHLDEEWFVPKNTQHRDVVRAIHYPAQKPPSVPKPGQVRASMHTDYGALTILRLGGAFPGGLQVMGATGTWIDVSTTDEEDAFVINLGDLMARWTNDRWMSTPHQVRRHNERQSEGAPSHRPATTATASSADGCQLTALRPHPLQVVNPPSEVAAMARRISIAYFCNVNMDAMVECIPTCVGEHGAKYEPIAAGEWLMRKHSQTQQGQLCYRKAATPSKKPPEA